MFLDVFDTPESAVLPQFCEDLKVFRVCEDDLPAIYMFHSEMDKAA